jgi:hypothetical protein
MLTLYLFPDDTVTLKDELRDQYLAQRCSIYELTRLMVLTLAVAPVDLVRAFNEMALKKHNVAEFGANRQFVLTRSVDYRDC